MHLSCLIVIDVGFYFYFSMNFFTTVHAYHILLHVCRSLASFLSPFLLCVSIACNVERCICLSVCLSHAGWYHVKTTQARIMGSSLEDSPMTLVSWRLTSPQKTKGNIGNEAPNKRGVGKIGNFLPINRHISDTVQDRTIVTMAD